MTQLSRAQDVAAVVPQQNCVTERENFYHRDLALEVYRQIFDRFGPIADVLLIELAHAPMDALSVCSRSLQGTSSLEEFVTRLGWAVPQGGEGNYSLDSTQRSRGLSFDARRQIQERLACLRRAQAIHSAAEGRNAAAAKPAEVLALDYERDPLARAYLQRAAIARTEGKSLGYHEGTLGALVVVLRTQLSLRFGELPEWAEERLENATLCELYDWVKGVVAADTLETALYSESHQLESIAL